MPDRLGGVDQLRQGARPRGLDGGVIVELAYARDRATEPSVGASPENQRPSLRVVPDLASAARPPLPRRPSRRAVVRAQVWGVPVTRHSSAADRVEDGDVDARIAEAVRLLAHL